MVFGKIKKLLGLSPGEDAAPAALPPDEGHIAVPSEAFSSEDGVPKIKVGEEYEPMTVSIPTVSAEDSPWSVPLLDIRPVTLTVLATSSNKQCAENLTSMMHDDGRSFVGQKPSSAQSCPTRLIYRIDRQLPEGVLFTPQSMDDKWALFHYDRKIICVRSWLRQVVVVAHIDIHADTVEITRIDGSFAGDDGGPAFNERTLDFLLRSHVLKIQYPVPLPESIASNPNQAALWCFAQFGNRAICATAHMIPRDIPEKPLRADTPLHIAAARGQKDEIKKQLALVPIDILANDGFTPLHWSLACEDTSIPEFLIDLGSPVDVRSADGATPLMIAAQGRPVAQAAMLLARGADPNAVDDRGFTALHRAAETGYVEIVKLLLDHGADADIVAEGHTAKSLAEMREQSAVVAILAGR